jgi:hypothetical protein
MARSCCALGVGCDARQRVRALACVRVRPARSAWVLTHLAAARPHPRCGSCSSIRFTTPSTRRTRSRFPTTCSSAPTSTYSTPCRATALSAMPTRRPRGDERPAQPTQGAYPGSGHPRSPCAHACAHECVRARARKVPAGVLSMRMRAHTRARTHARTHAHAHTSTCKAHLRGRAALRLPRVRHAARFTACAQACAFKCQCAHGHATSLSLSLALSRRLQHMLAWMPGSQAHVEDPAATVSEAALYGGKM